MVTERAVEVLFGQLEDLNVPNTTRFTFSELKDESKLNIAKVYATIFSLLERLGKYDGKGRPKHLHSPTISQAIEQVTGSYPTYRDQGSNRVYKVLFFLCSRLQAKRLLRSHEGAVERTQAVADTGKSMFQVVKICNNLAVDSSAVGENSEAMGSTTLITGVFGQVSTKIAALKKTTSSQQALPLLGLDAARSLTDAQRNVLEQLRESVHQDYYRRRCLMLKRADVTLQGFLWGENVAGKEGEIVAAIQAQRKQLSEQPFKYSVDDIFSAPRSLLSEFTRSVSTSASVTNNRSFVKTLIIGSVPDRGGRVSESTLRNTNISMGFGGHVHGSHGRGNKSHHHGHGSGNNRSMSAPSGSSSTPRKKQKQDSNRNVKVS